MMYRINALSESPVDYDLNGNILSLTRYGADTVVPEDSLAYSYDGDMLVGVINSGPFGGGGAYAHDANCNVTRDGLSGLDIEYDDLNLTSRVSSGDSTLAEYERLADGTKIRSLDGFGNGFQYRGSLIYTQAGGPSGSPALTLDCALTTAGRIVRVTAADGQISYKSLIHLRDHLGSVRAVIDGDTGTVLEASDYYPFGKRIPSPVTEPAEVTTSPNRWHFSGKESQSFLSASIPLLDFGARIYDPLTARWTARDPLAEEYYAVSPYAYCLGNPITIIDPKGEWITLYYDGHEYRFQDNQFLLYQTEGDYAGSFVPTSDMFIQTISSTFLELSKVETGKSLIDYFSNDNNNAYIQFDDGNNVINLSGICSTIYLNKELTGETVPTETGMQQMPFWLVVGHELSHRMDYLERRDDASKIWLDVDNIQIKNTEIQATHYENLMREEAGLPLRTHYATISTGKKAIPYEPSRLISRQGKSVVLPNVFYTPIKKRK